jgi:hypothetical protein
MLLNTNVADAGGSWASASGDDLNAKTAAAAMSRAQATATRRHDRLNDIVPPRQVLKAAAPRSGARLPAGTPSCHGAARRATSAQCRPMSAPQTPRSGTLFGHDADVDDGFA